MGDGRRWETATRVMLVVVAVLFVVLAVSGVLLGFRYRPEVAFFGTPSPHPWFTVRRVHQWTSGAFLVAVFALAASAVGLLVSRLKPWLAAIPVVAFLVALFASITGYALPWDQLSLTRVTVGSNIMGYGPILRPDRVRYVLIGAHEVSTAAVAHRFWIHTVVFPLVLLGLLLATALLSRRSRTAPPSAAPAPVE